jgi:hypothetical protein
MTSTSFLASETRPTAAPAADTSRRRKRSRSPVGLARDPAEERLPGSLLVLISKLYRLWPPSPDAGDGEPKNPR